MIKKQNQDRSGKRTVRLEETGSLFCCGSNSFLSSHLFALSFKFSPSSLSCSRFGAHTRTAQHAARALSLPLSRVNRESFRRVGVAARRTTAHRSDVRRGSPRPRRVCSRRRKWDCLAGRFQSDEAITR
jgi:hypothetical protein